MECGRVLHQPLDRTEPQSCGCTTYSPLLRYNHPKGQHTKPSHGAGSIRGLQASPTVTRRSSASQYSRTSASISATVWRVATASRSNQRRALRQGTRFLEQLPVFCLEAAAGELVCPAAWELRGRFPQSTDPAEVLRRKVPAAAAGHLTLPRQ